MLTTFSEKFGIDKAFSASWQTELKDQSLELMRHDIDPEGSLPFYDEYFDAVTMLAVFEHIGHQNLPKISQELYRVLKRGGLLIITTPAGWTGFILNGMARLRLISSEEIRDHKGLYTSDSIIKILQRGGFTSENIEVGYFEFYMNTWVTAIK
jgi:ubiquinone/menaquinone biosynthesis C-methylase UbiE